MENKKNNAKKKNWQKRVEKIRLLLLDVDGVLTDGRIIYDGSGKEWKSFDIKDGQGIKLLQRAGIEVGILSGRSAAAVRLRARELGLALVRQKVRDKEKVFAEIMSRKRLTAEEICFMGDDIVDVPVLRRVGFAVAVADGVDLVKSCAHYVTSRPGGRGAVREVCDLILRLQGKWAAVTEFYVR
jgi:3-deoxy-D-manno-octulosonate 8-phosphate phosphatase (KDO 8-P phosphatase)